MAFNEILNPVLSPLLSLPPVVSLLIISLFVSVIITFVYKWMTDQTKMKALKQKQKDFQKKIKEHKDNPKKAMEIQKEAMKVNSEYMLASLKPNIVTFIPIILIFGWLNANLAYDPIMPGEDFSAQLEFLEGASGLVSVSVPSEVSVVGETQQEIFERTAKFDFNSDEPGMYLLVFTHQSDNGVEMSYDKELIVTTEQRYAPIKKQFKQGSLESVTLSNSKSKPVNLFGKENGGWSEGRFGWLFVYIVSSIIFSTGLRRILKLA